MQGNAALPVVWACCHVCQPHHHPHADCPAPHGPSTHTAPPPPPTPTPSYRHSAMARLDPATGRPRGFMRMGRSPRRDSVLFTLDVRDEHWREASRCAWAVQGLL